MATDYNVKHPKLPYEGNYPNLHVSQDAAGNQIVKSLEPGKEAYFEIMASGSYYGHAADGSKTEVVVGKTHQYHADGVSKTADGHVDEKVSGSARSNSDGGRSSENGGDSYSGGSGHTISATQDSGVSHSSGDIFHTSEGNHVTQHDGNINHAVTGDMVEAVNGHKMEIITGEYGINIQSGNFDVQTNDGKTRIKSSDAILIDSDTSITLQVCGTSITITGSGIVINSGGDTTIKSSKRNVIRSNQGTKLEVANVPPVGKG